MDYVWFWQCTVCWFCILLFIYLFFFRFLTLHTNKQFALTWTLEMFLFELWAEPSTWNSQTASQQTEIGLSSSRQAAPSCPQLYSRGCSPVDRTENFNVSRSRQPSIQLSPCRLVCSKSSSIDHRRNINRTRVSAINTGSLWSTHRDRQ